MFLFILDNYSLRTKVSPTKRALKYLIAILLAIESLCNLIIQYLLSKLDTVLEYCVHLAKVIDVKPAHYFLFYNFPSKTLAPISRRRLTF